jgi:hypothetical protein
VTINEAEDHWPKIKIGTHETGLEDLRKATPEQIEAGIRAPTTVPLIEAGADEETNNWVRSLSSAEQN